jgi:hypothetical protein
MPQRALYDLAEAVLGRAPEMHWSMDEGIARRESSRLFCRLFEGSTTPDVALEVFVIGMMTKVQHMIRVIDERYNRLIVALTQDEQAQCPALNDFFEFFTTMSQDSDYAVSEGITRVELKPLFQACYDHVLNPADCEDAVFDYVSAKRETMLLTLQESVKQLNQELSAITTARVEKSP